MFKLKVVDLFAGIWWLSYGFYHNKNFEIIAANEIWGDMCKTYEYNHPWVKVYNMDIKKFWLANLAKDFEVKEWEIDVVIWWPPCQAYSTVGKRLLNDPRGKLFQEYHRVIKELQPQFFIYENVKGLLSMQKGRLMQEIIDWFSKLGYTVKYELLNMADYGVPQLRERVIMTWTRLHQWFVYPKKTHSQIWINRKKWLTLRDAIGDMPSLETWEQKTHYLIPPQNGYQKLMRKDSQEIADHIAPNNGEKLLTLMKHIPEWWWPQDIPKYLRPKSWFGNTYCRLRRDRPGMTITRNLWTPSSSRCIHPLDNRPLSTREWARIQSFPDSFRFYGNRSSKNLQIGNAVAPEISKILCQQVEEHFGLVQWSATDRAIKIKQRSLLLTA